MSKPSKKDRVVVSITHRDMLSLALMLRLHRDECERNVSAAYSALGTRNIDDHARIQRSAKSWARASRKAREFAVQLEELAKQAGAHQFPLPPVTPIR